MKIVKERPIVSRFVAFAVAGIAYVAAGALVALATSELPATWARDASALARLGAEHGALVADFLVVAGLVVLALGHARSERRGVRLTGIGFTVLVAAASLTLFAAPAVARIWAPIHGS
jgi:hypothetical protein